MRPLLIATSALLLSALSADAAAIYRADGGTLAGLRGPLANGARLRLEAVPLLHGGPETLELEKFEVWTPDAEILLFGAGGEVIERLPVPAAQYFRGRVEGQPDSLAFLSVSSDGVEGLVYAHERKFAVTTRPSRNGAGERSLVIVETPVLDDHPLPGEGFECEVEGSTLTPPSGRPRAVTNAAGQAVALAAPVGTQRSVINIAIETDYELYVNAGSATANVTTFIANLVGASSTIYERDLLTEIRLAYLSIHSNASDPFTVVPGSGGQTTIDALLELGTRWHNAPPTPARRSAVALISGKSMGAGVAWIDTLCSGDFSYGGGYGGAYSYTGGIDPPSSLAVANPNASPDYTASSNFWPLHGFTHELGHNVGSSHTHCVALTDTQKATYGVTRSFVDECYTAGGCFGGTRMVPAEKGSIMSYCHLTYGDASDTRYTFGLPGEPSEVIRNNMRAYMAAVTPSMSAITAPSNLAAGATGTASVTNVAGLTYSWSVSNGTINSGQGTSSIQFTPTAIPVSVTVTATNTSGCAITDTRTISTSVAPVAPTGVIATVYSSTAVSVSWNAVPGAASYQLWRSSGGSFVNMGNVGDTTGYIDPTPSPNTAYRYAVRAVASDGVTLSPLSEDDLATTVMFTDPTLIAGETVPKVEHFTQLLTAVNAVRTLAGQATITFSAPVPAAGNAIRAAHISQLRTALDGARSAIGAAAMSWADSTLTAGVTTIKADHIRQLRAGVQ